MITNSRNLLKATHSFAQFSCPIGATLGSLVGLVLKATQLCPTRAAVRVRQPHGNPNEEHKNDTHKKQT